MATEVLPRGFLVRPATMDDIEAVTELVQICERAEYGQVETTLEDISTRWHDPDCNLATDTWIVCSSEGQVVGFSRVWDREHIRIYTSGEVHPDYRRRGIGTYLLNVAETRALQHIPQAVPDARITLNSGASSQNVAGQRLLEQHQFKLIRHSWRMAIEMNEVPPVPEWAEGITVRTVTPDMARAVFEADDEAFKDHWGYLPSTFEAWEYWMIKRESYDPTLWFLAMDGNEIAGISLCKNEKELGGWVDTLGVRRRWRRNGIGLALLYHTFGEFYRRGISSVSLAVDAQSLTGATRLYERAGMHVVRQYNDYEKELRAGKELSIQALEG